MYSLFQSRQAIAVLAVIAAGALHAQPAPVLSGSQVTEEALADALDIGEPSAPDGARRGFSPAPRVSPTQPRPSSAGKANMLITFETGSATLTAEGKRVVDVLARALQSDRLAGLAFKVEGHADPRGGAEFNMQLSQARAKAVIDYLVEAHGILPERLDAIGKGSSELLDTQRQDAPENRRVTIVTKR